MKYLALGLLCTTLLLSCKKNSPESIGPVTPTTNYFPPIGGTAWESVNAADLGWKVDKLNEAIAYAESKKTYGLIILYKGRLVTERYWNGWNATTRYPIASAGKSVTAFLTGVAQREGLLNINQKTSDILGRWTSAPLAKENLITIKHQLSMTTGLDYGAPDDNCTTPNCLTYKGDAGSFWYYYNAPYRLLQDVVAKAASTNYNQYTKTRLADKIGMANNTWFDYVLWLNTRDMARFGLLILNKARWNGTDLLQDDAYFTAMTNTSQPQNQAYGYLWWLNGKTSFMTPATTFTFPGSLAPAAPADMMSALGKGDKKIYVVPSKELVVIRHGDDTGDQTLGPSSFDNIFWGKLMLAF